MISKKKLIEDSKKFATKSFLETGEVSHPVIFAYSKKEGGMVTLPMIGLGNVPAPTKREILKRIIAEFDIEQFTLLIETWYISIKAAKLDAFGGLLKKVSEHDERQSALMIYYQDRHGQSEGYTAKITENPDPQLGEWESLDISGELAGLFDNRLYH